MNKTEYMKILSERLDRFSQGLKEDILEDYEQHFAEGEKQGKSEEEIIRELGDIEEMLQELEDVDVESGEEAVVESGSTAAEQNFRYDAGCYKALELEGAIANILIKPSEDDKIHVDYKNDLDEKYKQLCTFYQYEENGVLHAGVNVKMKETEKRVKFLGRILTISGLLASGGTNSILLSVRVPSQMPKLSFTTTSGDVRMDKISAGCLKGKTSSGDVKARAVSAEDLRISASSGDLMLEDVKAREANLSSNSGDVRLDSVKAGRLHANTHSGDIEILGTTEVARGEFATASGDIEADSHLGADTVLFSTASGDIHVSTGGNVVECNTASGDIRVAMFGPYRQAGTDIRNRVLNCNTVSGDIKALTSGKVGAELNTVSGDIWLEMEQTDGMEAMVNTTSGDIGIRWQGQRQIVGKGCHRYGDGSNTVKANTVSGDIEIEGRGPSAD